MHNFKIPNFRLDSMNLCLTSPDAFAPLFDVIVKNGEYIIYMDVPGLTEKDITISRTNVITIVKGRRVLPYISFVCNCCESLSYLLSIF